MRENLSTCDKKMCEKFNKNKFSPRGIANKGRSSITREESLYIREVMVDERKKINKLEAMSVLKTDRREIRDIDENGEKLISNEWC